MFVFNIRFKERKVYIINSPWYTDPTEVTAFNAWACNESKLDSVADQIADQYRSTGCTSFTVDNITEEETEKIERRVNRRLSGF